MLTTHVQKCLYLLALIREEKKFCNALASLRLLTIGVTFIVYILFLDKSYETPFFEAYCTQIPLSDSASFGEIIIGFHTNGCLLWEILDTLVTYPLCTQPQREALLLSQDPFLIRTLCVLKHDNPMPLFIDHNITVRNYHV